MKTFGLQLCFWFIVNTEVHSFRYNNARHSNKRTHRLVEPQVTVPSATKLTLGDAQLIPSSPPSNESGTAPVAAGVPTAAPPTNGSAAHSTTPLKSPLPRVSREDTTEDAASARDFRVARSCWLYCRERRLRIRNERRTRSLVSYCESRWRLFDAAVRHKTSLCAIRLARAD